MAAAEQLLTEERPELAVLVVVEMLDRNPAQWVQMALQIRGAVVVGEVHQTHIHPMQAVPVAPVS